MLKKLRYNILRAFRLNHTPVIRVYNGYGNNEKIFVFGHVLKLSPMLRKTFRQHWLINTFSMLRLFMVKPYSNARISMQWNGEVLRTQADSNGFFKFEMSNTQPLNSGWHHVSVCLEEEKYTARKINGHGQVHLPYQSTYVFVSDIDDTFLISHTANLRKRLYVLFTKNAKSRRPFEGVVHHYQQLAAAGRKEQEDNPFFYVSSSEWNLYDLIIDFTSAQHLPKGVYLLNELKRFKEVFKTGQNKHATKFIRIVRIMEAYPQQQFVLFGDDSQQDPEIYLSLIRHLAGRIFAVYVRRVHNSNYETVQEIINKMTAAGTHACYFMHSSEAIDHSKTIGLII